MTIQQGCFAVPDDVDICVVGSGPVGMSFARECERLGLKVLVLEAGGVDEFSFPNWKGAGADIVDWRRHAPLRDATRYAFGGTGWAWAGICVPFDPIDLDLRPHVPYSNWPIQRNEIEPFYSAAAQALNCISDLDVDGSDLESVGSEIAPSVALISVKPNVAISNFEHFTKSRTITVCLHSPVIDINLNDTGTEVRSVTVANGDQSRIVRAPCFVIAAGGLRTTQLLLKAQRLWPRHFGGEDGPLGRFYMGHLNGYISTIHFSEAAEARRFGSLYRNGQNHARRRYVIRDYIQLSSRLLNTACWPSDMFLTDPSHGSGPLSAAFLIAAILGAKGIPPGLRHAYLETVPWQWKQHLLNVFKQPIRTTEAALQRIGLVSKDGASPQAPVNPKYVLQYHAEHAPNPDSRVALAGGLDELGLPRLRIDLRFTDADISSVLHAHDVLKRNLERSGRARLEYLAPLEERYALVQEQATDGYHQIGTTRMGTHRAASVVDPSCRAHDLRNLFIASSSVFPTSGQANPTLLATALAIRLAQHLSGLKTKARAPALVTKPETATAVRQTIEPGFSYS